MLLDSKTDRARSDLHRSIMMAFCKVLRESRLPPMTVISLAAASVGSIYKEVADEHRCSDACPCGWQPNTRADVEALLAALAATTQSASVADLRTIRVAGRA